MSEGLTTRDSSLNVDAGLLEYLKTAIDLENSVLTQKGIIQSYDASSERRKPALELMDEVEMPKYAYVPNGLAAISTCIGAFVGGIGLLMAVLCPMFASPGDIIAWSAIIWMIVVGLVLCLPSISIIRGRKAAYAEYWTKVDQVKTQNEQIHQENVDRKAQYQSKLWEWNESNKSAHAYFEKSLAQTQAVLDELYSREMIYPKYHNLPALTSIYEYLVTGRCEALSGAHGAYNLYEDEVRKDTVISQLNTVIENLEQIKQNQYMLYEQVKQIQQNTRVIAAELYAIRGYTAVLTELSALNAYYAGVTAMNTTALNYCRLLE